MALQKKVGNYEVERVVGKGSFGKAVLVRDSKGDRSILKLINTTRMSVDEVEEAKREIEAAFTSNYEHAPHLCIVMEYCAGGDLGNLILERKRIGKFFSEMTLRTWTLQLTLALDFMHKKKILHRDLKPANVFLDKENYIRVGDLGLSKVLEFTLQQAKTQCGTPAFMAPELCQAPLLPRRYSLELRTLSLTMLNKDPSKRPTTRDILNSPSIRVRIRIA